MFYVFECIGRQHDYRIVSVAALVCTIGAVSLFVILRRLQDCVARRKSQWLAVAAAVAGFGVWATHFIAMLAYRGAIPLRFNVALTASSALLAVAAFWLGLRVVQAGCAPRQAATASGFCVTGIAAMHFTGMAAIDAPIRIEYSVIPILIALAIGWGSLTLAFLASSRMAGAKGVAVPAALTVFAIVVLHFTAMTSTLVIPDPGSLDGSDSGSMEADIWLICAIAFTALALVTVTVVGTVIDRLLTDLHGLVGATREGLIIICDGAVVEANSQACAMIGLTPDRMIASSPRSWFQEGLAPEELDAGVPLEVHPRHPAPADQVLEVQKSQIEYRGRQCSALSVRDLTERYRMRREVEYLASHDPLTDLPNRAEFDRALRKAIDGGRRFSLIAVDLDRFKAVNDLFGHAAGDAILKDVAGILLACVDEFDVVARIGGDEFVILHHDHQGADSAQPLTARILAAFADAMNPSLNPMSVGCSLGVANFPRDGGDPLTLRHNADVALYRAKQEGRGQACFFDDDMDRAAKERHNIEHDLRRALLNDEFYLAFQPLVSTAFGAVVGYEALLRWRHPERGLIPPDMFVPIAEDTGAIIAIGEWVLREACRQAAQWPDSISIAVNVSPIQFQLPNLAQMIRGILHETGLSPTRLELEITESALLRNREATVATLHDIKAMGVRVAMDDFGTGYSSLSNLQSFPFDKIKIDRSFVSSVGDDETARLIVRAIVGLGRSLNLPVVAEGVETEQQRQMVLEEGCPQAQGFLFGSAEPAIPLADARPLACRSPSV